MPRNRQEEDGRVKCEQVYYAYRNYMLRIAGRILRNPQDAEDAVHDAFLSIAANISRIDALDSPRTRSYIGIITERKAIDLYRDRQKREGGELSEETAAPDAGRFPGHGLAACIGRLPPRYREIILLKYSHGYTIQEAADILGMKPAAAGKLLQRARDRLYDLCREDGLL